MKRDHIIPRIESTTASCVAREGARRTTSPAVASALRIEARGVVQGVGFRPYVYRIACEERIVGWVLNGEDGVRIHAQGAPEAVQRFVDRVMDGAPAAARIDNLSIRHVPLKSFNSFRIRESTRSGRPTTRMPADLPVCDACLAELFDSSSGRHRYPYINCTECGPRFSIITGLPYDRSSTTMDTWSMCAKCRQEYHRPSDRRFHAQPTACPECGPTYRLEWTAGATGSCDDGDTADFSEADDPFAEAAGMLREGRILAVKGIGGYHLACDARNRNALLLLRERKFRKDKPFAVMGRDMAVLEGVVRLSGGVRHLLESPARPIVLAPARSDVEHDWLRLVSPDNLDVGVMLPYAPVHHLLYDRGAPELLVMTSANQSSEPIAYEDDDARTRLAGIADVLLVGERPIARRVEDSVARVGALGPVVLRRGRGYSPAVVASLPDEGPILAVGADLKNSITLVVDGQALTSQFVGDLDHQPAYQAFTETVSDFLRMYEIPRETLLVAHDAHPDYRSRAFAETLPGRKIAVQHHRAHVASVLAENGALSAKVVAAVLDGTGYGDDGTIWGGEIFVGTVPELRRAHYLRPARLPGGDAAARFPVQAAAGFLEELVGLPDLTAAPFNFPSRYASARRLLEHGLRCFETTSAGRLFDVAAALIGFTDPITFEGQAAIWLEHRARVSRPVSGYLFPNMDWSTLLDAVIRDRLDGRPAVEIARAFHTGFASGLFEVLLRVFREEEADAIVLSGGVMQNEMLVESIVGLRDEKAPGVPLLTNHSVPPNDGGISLGQAAVASVTANGNKK